MKLRSTFILGSGLTLFAFMLGALLIMSSALRDSSQFSEFYSGALLSITLGLITLALLILMNMKHLIQQWRRRVPGARMIIRTIIMLTILSVTPILIVYLFSLDFLRRGIDSWFDLRVEQALDDSLELSRLALDTRMRELLKQTENIAEEVADLSNTDASFRIDEFRARSNAREMTILTRQGEIIISSSQDASGIVPNRPSNTVLLQLQQGGSYTGLDNSIDAELHIRVVVNLPAVNLANEARIIQALYPISEKMNSLSDSVQTAFVKYKELSYLRTQLKRGFIIILTLVLFFSLFAAIWTAFYFAKRLAAPIRQMAEATKAVAAGDYYTQIPLPGNDELGFLVASFNEMTQKIAQSREVAERSRYAAETQHAYLEAVLGRLSSGVLVLDQDQKLRTVNVSAGKILGLSTPAIVGWSLTEICTKHRYLQPFNTAIQSHGNAKSDWRAQLTFLGNNGPQILMCRGTPLQSLSGGNSEEGYMIIVFDDITALVQGQKNTAWSEMARHLAHEIKNPLTPIQLAAERLRHKYLHTMQPADADMLNRLTNTIIQQVETMQRLINTFSDYAKVPKTRLEPVDVNALINEVLDLFTGLDRQTEIKLQLAPNIPMVNADIDRLRQVLNNLLKNAFDAREYGKSLTLNIKTARLFRSGSEYLEIKIKDSGLGLAESMTEHIFEPYVTTKSKGTGLGLAIVKKIIEEHDGVVWLANNQSEPGVTVIIRLPIRKDTSAQARAEVSL